MAGSGPPFFLGGLEPAAACFLIRISLKLMNAQGDLNAKRTANNQAGCSYQDSQCWRLRKSGYRENANTQYIDNKSRQRENENPKWPVTIHTGLPHRRVLIWCCY